MEVKDLSKVHHLVSDIFKWPTDKKEWELYNSRRSKSISLMRKDL
jgi:hypothetical protein